FPWAAFLTGGIAAGVWLDRFQMPSAEARGVAALTLAGVPTAAAGYGASYLPPLYESATFWTSSPTFFFVRLGIVLAALGLGWLVIRLPGSRYIEEFGRASLFVYWIHVEMAYGVISTPLHRNLSFESAV